MGGYGAPHHHEGIDPGRTGVRLISEAQALPGLEPGTYFSRYPIATILAKE